MIRIAMNRLGLVNRGGKIVELMIDDRPFFDQLMKRFGHIPPERGGILRSGFTVNTRDLKDSLDRPGPYEILTCSECGHAPCVGIEMVDVTHEHDRIQWKVICSGAEEGEAPIELEFDRSHYTDVCRYLCAKIDPRPS